MKLQTKAARVLERTSHYINRGVIRDKPAWFDAVAAVPPAFDLAKKPTNLRVNQKEDPQNTLWTRQNNIVKTRGLKADRTQKNNDVSRIPKLEFLEDRLRDVFYHQHPWEFARPKTLIENKGTDADNCDWSRMLQLSKPLDGESVVQRTLWLLQNNKEGKPSTLVEAYDQARFEFYQLRMADEMESAVSREESTMFGAHFSSTNLQWGLAQEQEAIDRWVKSGDRKTKLKEAQMHKASASAGREQPQEEIGSFWDMELEPEPASEPEK